MFLRRLLGVFSIGVFAKNMGDPYYEPTIVVHDTTKINILKSVQSYFTPSLLAYSLYSNENAENHA